MKPLQMSVAKRCILASAISTLMLTDVSAEPIKGSLIPNCPAAGYSIYYINGINNTEGGAAMSTRALKVLAVSKAFDQEIIDRMKIENIHNESFNFALDAFEAIRQLGAGLVANVSAYFTAAFGSVLGLLAPLVPSLEGVLPRFIDEFRSAVIRPLSAAETLKVVNENVPKIVSEINQGKIVILVGHSQGNLFASEIYNEVKLVVPANKIGLLQVIHVASPSPIHVGSYIMNSTDFISSFTNGTATFTSASVNDYAIAETHNQAVFLDWLGHNFITTYLSKVPGKNGETLNDQLVSRLQEAFNKGMDAALESCPSGGGFSQVSLSCKRHEDGTATVSGLYSADLLPGEQITPVGWSTEYLTKPPENGCISPQYTFPDNRQFGIPAENIDSQCTPTEGLRLHPVSYAACHNPLSGQPRKIWIKMLGQTSKVLSAGGSVYVQFCRGTTINLNGQIPPNARPQVSIQAVASCM